MAPPTPTPAPNGTNATPEHRPPPALPPDPSEADIHCLHTASRKSLTRWSPVVCGMASHSGPTIKAAPTITCADLDRSLMGRLVAAACGGG